MQDPTLPPEATGLEIAIVGMAVGLIVAAAEQRGRGVAWGGGGKNGLSQQPGSK